MFYDIEILNTISFHLKKLFKDNYYEKELNEKYLKKIKLFLSDDFDKRVVTENIIKNLIKNNFVDMDEQISLALIFLSDDFKIFSEQFLITNKEFKRIFLEAKEELVTEYYSSPEMKKTLNEVISELPLILARIYNISIGMFIKGDGTELTLKEFSEISKEDYNTNLLLLDNARRLINKKMERRLKNAGK